MTRGDVANELLRWAVEEPDEVPAPALAVMRELLAMQAPAYAAFMAETVAENGRVDLVAVMVASMRRRRDDAAAAREVATWLCATLTPPGLLVSHAARG